MRLIEVPPRMTIEARGRLEVLLAAGACAYCRSDVASLVRRQTRGCVIVQVQCCTCGHAVGGALSRKEHFNWQSYPMWDEERQSRWSEQRQAEFEVERAAREGRFDEQRRQRETRSREYGEWCRASSEWHELSRRVMERAQHWCEACLKCAADVVHHETYELGVLPPAWMLRAVCRHCHDRLHADRLRRQDDWSPGSSARQCDDAE